MGTLMQTNVTIAGLGWLGKPFAESLKIYGYNVKGSVTDPKKAAALSKSGLMAYPMVISEDGVSGMVETLLSNTDILVCMIPPGLRRNTGANYALKMAKFLEAIETSKIKKLILISSTSVYADHQGTVTEKDVPLPETEAGKQLYEVEQLFYNAPNIECTVLRFGGLYGGSRNPVKFLAGRKDLANGDSPVNLIHREDCIGILLEIIQQDAFGHIINAVYPAHPLKKVYYVEEAKKLGLDPPKYSSKEEATYKQVESIIVPGILNYQFSVKL